MNKFLIISDFSKWNTLLQGFKTADSYYSFEYGKLFAKNENGDLFSAYYEDENTKIFYPFIKRKVSIGFDELYDIVTPYGYGGHLIEDYSESSMENFCYFFYEYCKENNIITETIRFHPILENHNYCKKHMDVTYIRQTTAVDLKLPLEVIRKGYTKTNYRNIKKAKDKGISCYVAEANCENIQTFFEIYIETMDRNKASNYYYFSKDYFTKQMENTSLSRSYLLFAVYNEIVVAGVLVIVGKDFSHYHLGASRTKYLDLRPNNILFDFMVEFCKEKGSKVLHLGGGYQENDGLFKFKSSFTNNNNFSYYIGKKVHNIEEYNRLNDYVRNSYEVNENFFPVYRGGINKEQKLIR
ncbi:lipid II:glycine glycyltransferase FemX [Fredinandcohnia humi]